MQFFLVGLAIGGAVGLVMMEAQARQYTRAIRNLEAAYQHLKERYVRAIYRP